jgi:hypothetical protein
VFQEKTARWFDHEVTATRRIEAAKFSRSCPKGRLRYYLREMMDVGSTPKSAWTAGAKARPRARMIGCSFRHPLPMDGERTKAALPARIRHPPNPIDGLENGLKSPGCRQISVASSRTKKKDNQNLSITYRRYWIALEYKGRLLRSPQRSWRLSPPRMMKDVFTMERLSSRP